MSSKRRNIAKWVLAGFVVLLVVVAVAFGIYVSSYYHATASADSYIENPAFLVSVKQEGDLTIYQPESIESTVGLIFYPGGKVEAAAYAPLMKRFAEQGITAVLVEMPFNLAVFGIDRADQVYSAVPEVTTWYIGGHSLGGAMAGTYAVKHPDKVEGLILMGAYPTGETELPILQIIGTNDEVVNRNKLSNTATTVKIPGGNHAYFGNYGEQKSDGEAAITPELQQAETIEASIRFMTSR